MFQPAVLPSRLAHYHPDAASGIQIDHLAQTTERHPMRLHHVAYVTKSVDEKASRLAQLLGFQTIGPAVLDPTQGVRIQFMDMGRGELIELLEPHGDKSPVQRHLDKGGGLYHLCFEVDDLDGTLQRLRDSGEAVVVRDPVSAPAIENRRVAFVMTSDRDLIEFVEVAHR
jgi:methylmalonyl-CoA epimerase